MTSGVNAIVGRWRLTELTALEADGTAIQLVIETGGAELRVTVPVAEEAVRAIRQAESWNAAVYPPGGLPEFAHPMRARAWDALSAAGEDRPNAAKVTEFLRDWSSWGQQPGEPADMMGFAVTWRKLRYCA